MWGLSRKVNPLYDYRKHLDNCLAICTSPLYIKFRLKQKHFSDSLAEWETASTPGPIWPRQLRKHEQMTILCGVQIQVTMVWGWHASWLLLLPTLQSRKLWQPRALLLILDSKHLSIYKKGLMCSTQKHKKKASFLCKLVTSSQKGSYDANWINIPESSDISSWSEELCQHLQNSLRDGASVDCDSKKRGHSCIHCPVSFSTQFNPPTAMNVDCDLCKQSAQAKVVVAGPALEFGLQQTHRAVE